jgi:hypothetical protein
MKILKSKFQNPCLRRTRSIGHEDNGIRIIMRVCIGQDLYSHLTSLAEETLGFRLKKS